MPGWTGLANARVTIFGDVYPLPADMQDAARDVFLAKHQAADRKERWVLGNFAFFRMHRVTDIYFVGGFGTVQWIGVDEYLGAAPDAIATHAPQRTLAVRRARSYFGPRGLFWGGPEGHAAVCSAQRAGSKQPTTTNNPTERLHAATNTKQELNEAFASDLARHLDPEAPADEALLISIDALGADVRVRHGSEFGVVRRRPRVRLGFCFSPSSCLPGPPLACWPAASAASAASCCSAENQASQPSCILAHSRSRFLATATHHPLSPPLTTIAGAHRLWRPRRDARRGARGDARGAPEGPRQVRAADDEYEEGGGLRRPSL